MAKSAKKINPADAHRKAQRKRELKKNKEDRKKARLVAAAQKDVTKLALELQEYRAVEATDPLASMKIRGIEDKVKKINQARAELGLPPVDMTIQAAPKRKTKKQQKEEEDLKWYHPTFNPHGPKKPAKTADESSSDDSDSSDESESDEESGESDSESHSEAEEENQIPEKPKHPNLYPARKNGEPEPKLRYEDLSFISLPEGKVPSYEAQIYHTLELPEIRDQSDAPKPKPKPVPPQATISRPPGPYPGMPMHHRPMLVPPPFHNFPPGMPIPPNFRPPPFGMPPLGPPFGPPMGGPPPHGYPYGPPMHGMPPPPFRPPGPPFYHPGQAPYPPYHPAAFGNAVHAAPPRPFIPPPQSQPQSQPQGPPQVGDVPSDDASPAKESPLPTAPTVIAAAPKMRDLLAESVKLVPNAVRKRKAAGMSAGRAAKLAAIAPPPTTSPTPVVSSAASAPLSAGVPSSSSSSFKPKSRVVAAPSFGPTESSGTDLGYPAPGGSVNMGLMLDPALLGRGAPPKKKQAAPPVPKPTPKPTPQNPPAEQKSSAKEYEEFLEAMDGLI